jgi:peptidoglycan/LPS O-acetylase OafA/YrhL
MTRNLRIIFLIIFTFFSPLVAKADWEPGPPIEAVIAIGIAVFVIVFCILALISLVIKSIVEFFRKDKKTHIWFQTIVMFLFLGILFYAEEQENLLYDVEVKYSYEKRVQTFYFLIFLAMSFGWIIGYWITPKKKNNLEKSISENP